MRNRDVLIVEDDVLISLDVEQALVAAGYAVCGLAATESAALSLAEQARPGFAVVDLRLAPGDGRRVARELIARYETRVLLATAHCRDLGLLSEVGVHACLTKPYSADSVPAALEAVAALQAGTALGLTPPELVWRA